MTVADQFSGSKQTDWQTPPEVFEALDREFHFTLDAAASHENALCDTYCTIEGTWMRGGRGQISDLDGLAFDWSLHRVFCNPPYDDIRPWVEKASQITAGVAVLLIPTYVDRGWFHDYVWPQDMPNAWAGRWVDSNGIEWSVLYGKNREVRFRRGRIRFIDPSNPDRSSPNNGNLVVVYRD